jgi:hypothetical protein
MSRSADALLTAILMWMVSLLIGVAAMIFYDTFSAPSLLIASLSTGLPATLLAVLYLATRVNPRPQRAVEAVALGVLQGLCTAATLQVMFSLVPEIVTDPAWSGTRVMLYGSSVSAQVLAVAVTLYVARKREPETQVD